jgi:hypothetical protein
MNTAAVFAAERLQGLDAASAAARHPRQPPRRIAIAK